MSKDSTHLGTNTAPLSCYAKKKQATSCLE